MNWLDEREIQRTRELRTSQARLQFVFCRAVREIKTCESLNCINEDLAFESCEFGRPATVIDGAAARIHFSVSQSGEYELVAISNQRQLGVDLEIRNSYRNFSGISNQAFSTNERQALDNLDRQKRIELFYEVWTIKEALIKVLGTGFHFNPTHFKIPPAMLRRAKSEFFRFPHNSEVIWRLKNISSNEFAACLAYQAV